MQEIAVAASIAVSFCMLSAFGFSEVSNRYKLCNNCSSCVKKSLHRVHTIQCRIFIDIFDPDISDHVISNVVSDNKILDFTVVSELHEYLFIKVLKVVDCVDEVLFWDFNSICFDNCGIRILVKVLENHRLGKRWLVMESCASVSMSTGANFEVKRAIYFVLLRTKNFSESFGHRQI